MNTSRSLFERLRTGGSRSHESEQDLDDLRHSICKNLERILNARSGMSQCCDSYGLPDMTQIIHGIPERAREIEQALERCIRDYEPRVSQVEVEHVLNPPDAMTACFKIRAAVATGKSAEEIWFETVVVSSGRVRLT